MSNFPGFTPLKSNFTQTPNQFFDKVVGHYHPCVVSVVAILIRSTLGWEDQDTGERLIEADLPISAFVRPEISEQSARRGIAGAIEAGFIIQTQRPGPRSSARYALRWDDAEAQRRAIAKQRAAQRVGRKTTRRGTTVAPLKKSRGTTVAPLRGTTVRGATVVPPIDNKEILVRKEKEKQQQQTGSSPETQGRNSDVVVFNDFRDEEVDADVAGTPAVDPALPPAALEDRAALEAAAATRSLADEMVACNMAEPVAMKYAAKWPEECRRQLDFMPYQDAEVLRNPAGFLRSAIELPYGPPAAWKQHEAALAEAETKRKKQEEFNRFQDAKEAAGRKADDLDKARAKAVLDRMSEAEVNSLDSAVRINVKVKDKVNLQMFAANKQKMLLIRFYALPEGERQEIEKEISI